MGFSTPKTYTTKYEYDLERKLKKITYPSGKEIENIYNKTLLTSTKTAQGVTNFEYNCLKNISKINYGSESMNYSYDGTLLKSLNYSGALSKNINFDYNNNFKISKISYANRSYNLTYDNDLLLNNIGNFAISRNSNNGLATSISDGKSIKTRTYNSYGEINQTSDNIFSYSLKRDKNGKIIQKTETISGNQHIYKYSYDDNRRLIEVKKDNLTIEIYGYDENGNRNSSTVNEDDQTLTYKNINYTYNSDGYLISKEKNSQITGYEYGIYGELKKVTTSTKTIEYEHNANHQRVVKKIVEKYLWLNLTTLLAIYDKDNNLIQQFKYADQRMPINMIQNGNKYYLHYDQIGTVKAISDENLTVVKKIEYDSYGNILNDTNSTLKIPFGFAGGLYDQDTDLTRFGFRDYDSYIGKWTAKDPIDFGGGDSNLYGYVLNNPINFIDPRGLSSLSSKQCSKLKEILAFERSYGTLPTAIRYSGTWGNPDYKIKTVGADRLGGNTHINSSIGLIDLDWYLDLASFGYGLQASTLYPIAKTIWNWSRKKPFNNIYELSEARAINTLTGFKSLNELFKDTCNYKTSK